MKNKKYILILVLILIFQGCSEVDSNNYTLKYNNNVTYVKTETDDFNDIKKQLLSKIFIRYTNNERYCLFTYENTEFIQNNNSPDEMLHIIYPKSINEINKLKSEMVNYLDLIDTYKISHKEQIYLKEIVNIYINLLDEVSKITIKTEDDKIYFYDNNLSNVQYMELRNKIIQKIYQE